MQTLPRTARIAQDTNDAQWQPRHSGGHEVDTGACLYVCLPLQSNEPADMYKWSPIASLAVSAETCIYTLRPWSPAQTLSLTRCNTRC